MKALIIIDYINEISHKDGKLAGKGYYNFIQENNIFENMNKKIKKAKENEDLIIFVKLAFDKNYKNQPKNSPLFWKANEFRILQENTWGTEIHEELDFDAQKDLVVIKNRVNAFYGTNLDVILKNNQIQDLEICGVATDLAVSSCARDAHDRDYNVTILENCCTAANIQDHKNAIESLEKIGKIV